MLVRYKKRSHPSREMKSTDKVPVKQPGWCWRDMAWRYWLWPVWRIESRGEKENLANVTGKQEKKTPDLSKCNQRFANLWQSRRSNDSISIVKGAPLYNQHCAYCQKNIQNIHEDTQVDSFSSKYQVPAEKNYPRH